MEEMGRLEDAKATDIRGQIHQAILALQVAQEILAGLTLSEESSIQPLLRERASALGAWLTRAELDAISRYVDGQSPAEIAEERGLSERTISNQIRAGCRKLGFDDRRELKGWSVAARGFILTEPPEDR